MLHSLGAAIAESGVPKQPWHADAPYPLEWGTAAGSDMPPYAITMMVPLLNLTLLHGPTAFCIGSSHTHGVYPDAFFVQSEDSEFRTMAAQQLEKDHCASSTGLREVQFELQFGDAVLFDYQTLHRGAENLSPDTRAVLYLTFSRPWYKDEGFDDIDGEATAADARDLSEAATAPLASAAGTPLSELSRAQQRVLGRVSRPARFAEPFAPPNDTFTSTYQKQAVEEGAAPTLEHIAGRGHLFPSWVDIDDFGDEYTAGLVGADQGRETETAVEENMAAVLECSAGAVFTDPYSEEDFW